MSEQLASAGLFDPAIRPPSVPPNGSRLRISISSTHTNDQLDKLTQELHRLKT